MSRHFIKLNLYLKIVNPWSWTGEFVKLDWGIHEVEINNSLANLILWIVNTWRRNSEYANLKLWQHGFVKRNREFANLTFWNRVVDIAPLVFRTNHDSIYGNITKCKQITYTYNNIPETYIHFKYRIKYEWFSKIIK